MTKSDQNATTDDDAIDTGPKAPAEPSPAARKPVGKGIWMGTAVGIGSAAIVAALLYTNRKRS